MAASEGCVSTAAGPLASSGPPGQTSTVPIWPAMSGKNGNQICRFDIQAPVHGRMAPHPAFSFGPRPTPPLTMVLVHGYPIQFAEPLN